MPDTGAHARTEAHKDAIRRLYKALEAGDVDVADELFTDDFVTSEGRHQNVRGPQGFKDAIRGVHSAYTDPTFEILDMVAEGDAVTLRWRMRATHTGELMGVPPTGRQISMEAFALFRFTGDRVSERHAVIDRLGLLRQLQDEGPAA
ncbi:MULTISPECIES: ester cyclase [unclassified Streptomyces]|uniref:ester cyclase n=1 Tax=unclassified Streptomyces TaxID=2593676 RepID=UPI002DD9FC1A|nr:MULTISPECIES: ester cyclase [unclassified Streptomyces]WSA90953.1 ester cyclase [Streptomyces sp. NBC_01795]WSB75278.1 ester cyclase [Streptomyces sp. NBC_01775]WSS16439.1 ester cyclase [Streptomyces sp. NBC_01186]WSS45257.1 ester cyclase [Streptomyces sp. NBC_01187]